MQKILVVIVTYNGLKWLEKCLGSISGADVLVVDNASSDGSAEFIKANFPDVRLVQNAENKGFTDANNYGFKYALENGYDYVYLMNQDAWLEPDTLPKLIEAAESNPEYAILSPMQMQADLEHPDRLFARLIKNDFSEEGIYTVRFVMAAHWLVRCSALRKIGLFAPLFPIYGQDDNLCDRAYYNGFKVGIVPNAKAVHDRATRKESKDKIIFRNYYNTTLVRLCDPNKPLWRQKLWLIAYTLVKSAKYLSLKPFSYFFKICSQTKDIKETRKL